MSIQFACPGCRQPIEVDEEHAGRIAACPYCRQVVTVPQQSTYQPEDVPTARPAEAEASAVGRPVAPAPPTPGSLHVGPDPSARILLARRFGNLALLSAVICAAATVATLVVVVKTYDVKAIMAASTQPAAADQPIGEPAGTSGAPASQPTLAEVMQQQQKNLEELYRAKPWLYAVNWAGPVFALLGLIGGIVSLAKWRRGNWRGLLSVLLCGGYWLLLCGGFIYSVAIMHSAGVG